MAKNDFQYDGWNYYTMQCELQSRQSSLSIPALATDIMDILCGQHCYKDMAVQ